MTKKNSTKGAAKQEIDLMLSCYCCTQNNACNAKNVMQLIQLSFDRYIIILYDCSCDQQLSMMNKWKPYIDQ